MQQFILIVNWNQFDGVVCIRTWLSNSNQKPFLTLISIIIMTIETEWKKQIITKWTSQLTIKKYHE